jgi:hypothetical protein
VDPGNAAEVKSTDPLRPSGPLAPPPPPKRFSELLLNTPLLSLFKPYAMFTVLLERLEEDTWFTMGFGSATTVSVESSLLELRLENIAILSLTLFLLGSSPFVAEDCAEENGDPVPFNMLEELGVLQGDWDEFIDDNDDGLSNSFFLSSKLGRRPAMFLAGITGGTVPGREGGGPDFNDG